MATLNLCDCGKNFVSTSAHAAHFVGTFGVDRRCMTAPELQAKGWTMTIEPVKRRRENKPYVQQMETWHTPMNEAARAYFARLRASRQTGESDKDEPEDIEE